ncbi:plasmid replication initiation protein [Nitrospirillum amazonense]|uniref:Plasmid replication initiation protein n=2 Tax=Nitrospirillum amazonense TaxID=28077 RepID=A0A560KI27_9PROT|nr:plasmid replication initiation protein [Nitrospirillum amazonense]
MAGTMTGTADRISAPAMVEAPMAGSQLALALDSPLIGKVKNDRLVMVFNFFALSKETVTELPVYDDGTVRIEVTGTKHGVANIWDKEVLIYLVSLIQDKLNRGEPVSPRLTFTGHDFFRVVGIHATNTAYQRLEDALKRLQSTQVLTNLETGGEGETGAFSWVLDYRINYRRDKDGGKTMKSLTVQLCDWLYRAVVKDRKILTYHPDYFKLSPTEKRLYEIARAHCGNQGAFKMNIEKLRLRVGAESDLKVFKARLVALAKKRQALPEYGLTVVDPRRWGRDRNAPPPPGRTPLKSHMVYFFRTDSLSAMAPFDQAPEFPDAQPDMMMGDLAA